MLPLIRSFPFSAPMSSADSVVTGTNLATGLPCLVIRTHRSGFKQVSTDFHGVHADMGTVRFARSFDGP